MNKIIASPSDNLQDILDNCPDNTTIYLKNGVYEQKIVVRGRGLRICGEGRETTKIIWSDYAKKPHADGGEYNTFRTYTVCITGEGVRLENLTIENGNTHPEKVGQCVALSVNARSFWAKDVDLRSTQDTLFTAPFPDDLVVRYSGLTPDPAYYEGFIPREQLYMQGISRQIYENCRIFGTVDFIFGGAEAYFVGCELISTEDARGTGYVAAPSHPLACETGYVFYDCAFVCGGAGKDSVYLARPWRDFGKCEFLNCTLEGHINPSLFDKWNDTYRDNTARFLYSGLQGKSVDPVKWSGKISPARARELVSRIKELGIRS